MCGQCVLHSTGMTCPMTCPKTLRNGPVRRRPRGRPLRGEARDAVRLAEGVRARACRCCRGLARDSTTCARRSTTASRDTSSWVNLVTGRDRQTPAGWKADGVSSSKPRARRGPASSSRPRCRSSTAAASTPCGATSSRRGRTWTRSTRPTTPPRTRTPRRRDRDRAAAARRGADHAGRLPRQEPARAAGRHRRRALHGVENICCLTGDDVTAGDEPEARRVFDLDGPQLVAAAAAIARGRYLSGRRLEPAPHLFVGAVENPAAPPFDYRAERAREEGAGGRPVLPAADLLPPGAARAVHGRGRHGRARRARGVPAVGLPGRERGRCAFMDERVPGIEVPADMIARVERRRGTRGGVLRGGVRAGRARAVAARRRRAALHLLPQGRRDRTPVRPPRHPNP